MARGAVKVEIRGGHAQAHHREALSALPRVLICDIVNFGNDLSNIVNIC